MINVNTAWKVTWVVACISLFASVYGCGGSPAGTKAGTGTIFGLARNNVEDFEGATVQVVAGKTVLAETLVGHGGAFTAKLSRYIPCGAFTVEVALADGEVYRTRVAAFADKGFVYVNALTNLVATYHDTHPDVSVDEARQRVHAFVGIRNKADLGDRVANPHYARFSSTDFNAAALGYADGRLAFYEMVAKAVDNGTTGDSLQYTHGEGYDWPAMDGMDLDGMDNDPPFSINVSEELVDTADQGIAAAETVTEEVGEDLLGELGSVLGDSLIDNIMHICINHIPGIGDSPTIDEILDGINKIESQLDNIENTLANLEENISQEFAVAEYTTLAGQLTEDATTITSAYGLLYNINQYTGMNPPDTTDLATAVQTLNQKTVTDIQSAAANIYSIQFASKDSELGVTLMSLARSLSLADTFIGTGPVGVFQNQVNYYASLQAEAASVLQALAAPYMASDGSVNFTVSPAGTQNLVTGYNKTIMDNIQEEISALPYGAPTDDVIYGVKDNVVFAQASVDQGTAGTNWSYAASYTGGGVNAGGWRIADTASIQNCLYNRISAAQPSSGTYVDLLNSSSVGFNLKPGKVTYREMVDEKPGNLLWDTDHAFLTIGYDGTTVTVGYIDDTGATKTYGSFTEKNPANIPEDLNYYFYDAHGNQIGAFDGPVILMAQPSTDNTDINTISPISYELYNGFSFTQGPVQYDPYSNNTSAVQLLAVYPTFPSGQSSTYCMNNEVYFTSSDESIATISNVVQPPDQTDLQKLLNPSLSSPVNDTPAGPITTPANMAGMIHWLPGSDGKTVTFTASRYLTNGTSVVSSSTDVTLPTPPSKEAAQPDAVDVWPSSFGIYDKAFNLADPTFTGVQLHVSRHWGQGRFDDVTQQVTYASSDPRVSVNSQGLVSANQALPDGTVVTITVTDPLVPAGETDTRSSATATITVIEEE